MWATAAMGLGLKAKLESEFQEELAEIPEELREQAIAKRKAEMDKIGNIYEFSEMLRARGE